MNQQRDVVALQAQLLERRRHVRDLADARVVIAKQHKDGVFVVTARLGQFHQPPDIEIQQAHGVVLLHAARTGGLDLLNSLVADLKTVVVFGDGKRPMVARSLHVGKERFVGWQRTQDPVTLLEQVQSEIPQTSTCGDFQSRSSYSRTSSILRRIKAFMLAQPELPPIMYSFSYPLKSLMMVFCRVSSG